MRSLVNPNVRLSVSQKGRPHADDELPQASLGLRVSPLCLGTMNFGPRPTRPTATRSWTARSSAASTSSTPPTSTAGRRRGRTEQIVGRWFAQGGGRREKVVLATKVYGGRWPTGRTRRGSRRCTSATPARTSLRRLQTDHIDLYQMHHVDRDTPWDEIWQAMELLVAQGKVLYVGSSNFAGWHIAQANEAAAAPRLPRPRVRAEPLQPARPHGRARGAAGVPRATASASSRGARSAAACSAARSQKVDRGPPRRRAGRRSRSSATATSSRRGRRCAASSARSPPTSRSRGCCTNPVVTAPIIGPRTMEQLDGAPAGARRSRSTQDDARASSTRSSRAPAAPAPEAYAW